MSSESKVEQTSEASSMEIGTITFPFTEAFRYCLESIKKRFTRALITAVSILLGIAFYVTIRSMNVILPNVGQQPPQAYQLMMAIIALLVCGVGIINSMLMSVTERYKEIGTIKCLGATDTSVLEIFLIEALLLGLLGGVIGSFAGWIAAIGIYGVQYGIGGVFPADKIGIVMFQYLRYISEGIGISAFLSVAAAAYPAFYASRLHPAEALRYEV
ncbi:FtsX-like permease family protein [Candidatus Bathyarchaeota archaeon]|nr:MAG: FtsX-like permease family protein [Candidatus Bathyarchaeota archaeon]